MIVIAGPNGAGKSTASARLLPSDMTFVNADEIAKGLPGYPSPGADLEAGRIALRSMEELEAERRSFATETTLASRTLATRIRRLRASGYFCRIIFAWIPDPELSIRRVATRVRTGGHHVPDETIRRRYYAGLKNFFTLYQEIADHWIVFDTRQPKSPVLVAEGRMRDVTLLLIPEVWQAMREGGQHG